MDKMKIIDGKNFDEERALYNLTDAKVINCTFDGDADGESALKETRNVKVRDCRFSLRYPLWHAKRFSLKDSVIDGTARAPIWYASDGVIENCTVSGVKCLRECNGITVMNSKIESPEFGWKCKNTGIFSTDVISEYFLFGSENADIDGLHMTGKYSFQYVKNMTVCNSVLDTKDAFWHSKNVTVKNCTVKGEYLGWYSYGLTLIDCKIVGTQPLCYAKKLKLVNCTMEDTDFSFEYSDVSADIVGNVLSVKNPRSGVIKADSIGSVILDDSIFRSKCRIITDD